jgi:hypothetical protein
MECFRIDESGYTGFDLLNPEQAFPGGDGRGHRRQGRCAFDQRALSEAASLRTQVSVGVNIPIARSKPASRLS